MYFNKKNANELAQLKRETDAPSSPTSCRPCRYSDINSTRGERIAISIDIAVVNWTSRWTLMMWRVTPRVACCYHVPDFMSVFRRYLPCPGNWTHYALCSIALFTLPCTTPSWTRNLPAGTALYHFTLPTEGWPGWVGVCSRLNIVPRLCECKSNSRMVTCPTWSNCTCCLQILRCNCRNYHKWTPKVSGVPF